MAFTDFADTQYIKSIDTGEEIRVGSFQTIRNEELVYYRPTIYINGTATISNEKMRVNIYSDSAYTSKLYSSEWASLSDISGLTDTGYWIGWVRLDFNNENLNLNKIYYPTIEMSDYTRNGETFWIGACHDFPFPIYDNSENFFYDHPLALQLFGKEL